MNRSLHKPLGCLEVDMVSLFGNFAVGGAGAPTLDTNNSKGIASVTRNSAGKYTVALTEPCAAFLWANAVTLDSANSAQTVGTAARLFSQAVTSTTAPVVIFQFNDVATGAAADPASGATIYFKVEMRNSTVTGY